MQVIVAIKDTAARVFGIPFFVQASAQAIRSLSDEVNSSDKNSDVARHPEDFELYQIAVFNEQVGSLVVDDGGPVLLVRAKDLIRPAD